MLITVWAFEQVHSNALKNHIISALSLPGRFAKLFYQKTKCCTHNKKDQKGVSLWHILWTHRAHHGIPKYANANFWQACPHYQSLSLKPSGHCETKTHVAVPHTSSFDLCSVMFQSFSAVVLLFWTNANNSQIQLTYTTNTLSHNIIILQKNKNYTEQDVFIPWHLHSAFDKDADAKPQQQRESRRTRRTRKKKEEKNKQQEVKYNV